MGKPISKYTAFVGGMKFRLDSEVINGEVLDTTVKLVEGDVLCTIAGNQIKDFVTEFKALVEKYSI